MLRHTDNICDVASAVRSAIGENVPLSLKLRCGFYSPDEITRIIPVLSQAAKINRFFIHHRTVSEGYLCIDDSERKNRWQSAITAVKNFFPDAAVIINGDIKSSFEAISLVRDLSADGIMAARPWLADPWLLKRIAAAANPHETAIAAPLPDIDEGKEIFFNTVKSNHDKLDGHLIEVAKLLWGVNSKRFRDILAEQSAEPRA
jgi:tRNA-dihydrouridine synthase